MMKKRGRGGRGGLSGTEEAALAARRAGMLDAYTEASNVTMSDSDKFKEGYKKKGKKSEKARKSESEDTVPVPPPAEEPTESWDNEVEEQIVDSWEDIEAPEMPVPPKVKQTQRKQEKMRKKEEEQQRKKEEAAKNQKIQEQKIQEQSEKCGNLNTLISKIENVSLDSVNKTGSNEAAKPSPEAVKADREAKKAAKAAAKAAAKNKKTSDLPDKEASSKEAVTKEADGIKDPTSESALTEEEKKKIAKAKRKAEFEAKRAAQTQVKSEDDKGEGKSELQGKSKAELKAERRAKQEAQRAAKAQAQEQKKSAKNENDVDQNEEEKKLIKKTTKPSSQNTLRVKSQKLAPLFSHLQQYDKDAAKCLPVSQSNIHPSFVRLGLQLVEGGVVGCEQKCVALLRALQDLVISSLAQFKNLSEVEIFKEIETNLKPNLLFLKQCRPLSLSMENCVRVIKSRLKALDSMKNDSLENILDETRSIFSNLVNENLNLAARQISLTAGNKIKNGDVILTYSGNDLIQQILLDAAKDKKFKVIVVDGRLQLRGSEMTARLSEAGLETTYILISAASQLLSSVDKVFLGCEAVMANGGVLAEVGTSQVALLAESAGIPVLMCCQSFKFTERVQTDSFVYNELLDPTEVMHNPGDINQLDKWKEQSSLHPLNLAYDVTPASLVSAVITEISVVPTTSVPVILRLKNSDTY